MIYLVSGYMRSGTSMMMQALEAGGLECLKDEARDTFADVLSSKSYKMNPNGLYELMPKSISGLDDKSADGKLLKVVSPWLDFLPISSIGYRCIFMLRDALEIKESMLASLAPDKWKRTVYTGIEDEIKRHITYIKNRRDVETVCLDYETVITWPMAVMTLLSKNGWPIDASKAAQIPSRKNKRFSASELATLC